MSKTLDDIRRAKETEYIEKQNNEKLAKLASRLEQTRLSPVTGEPLVQEDILGVTVDRCPTSGGIWLDAGEIEQILAQLQGADREKSQSWFEKFLEGIHAIKIR